MLIIRPCAFGAIIDDVQSVSFPKHIFRVSLDRAIIFSDLKPSPSFAISSVGSKALTRLPCSIKAGKDGPMLNGRKDSRGRNLLTLKHPPALSDQPSAFSRQQEEADS